MIENKYKLGQEVWYKVTAEVKGTSIKLSSWEKFFVIRISLDADAERVFVRYAISQTTPQPYGGHVDAAFTVTEDELKTEKPSDATSTIR